ncbi:MAG: hypothetical protein GY866_13790 [Proteobacteria bacterium]|nr:hypothetical protein [Pseudomonadota bacterium]
MKTYLKERIGNPELFTGRREDLDFFLNWIDRIRLKRNQSTAILARRKDVSFAWSITLEAPKRVSESRKEFIVQMIDEFQFINSEFYWDKDLTRQAPKLCGGYLSAAESKTAPLLVTGSWVEWLMSDLFRLLPGRFKMRYLRDMPEAEIVEMVFKFASFLQVPVAEEVVFAIARIAEGNPFYVASILDSSFPNKDLATLEGLARTFEFETLSNEDGIKGTWMEYVRSAFRRLNGVDEKRSTKSIVLYLCTAKTETGNLPARKSTTIST